MNLLDQQKVRLISITKPVVQLDEGMEMTAEGLMAYTARVSSPKQDNPKYAHLMKFCIKNKHWSVFELADMTVEIITTRAIAQQILRHKSFSFSEFSQRYSEVTNIHTVEGRLQDHKDRQNSIETNDQKMQDWWQWKQALVHQLAEEVYNEALENGIAKECARFVLPVATETKMYMKGPVRSWITYFMVRDHEHAQLEHQDVAKKIKAIFVEQFPVVSEAMGWHEKEDQSVLHHPV